MVQQRIRFLIPKSIRPELPLLVYLPGMDGTGSLLQKQVNELAPTFDIRCLSLPTNDTSTWEQLVAQAASLIQQERDRNPQRPVYLCGESFGGCLALQLAVFASDLTDYLILVNPASSFNRQVWTRLSTSLVQWFGSMLYDAVAGWLVPFLIAADRVNSSNRRALLAAMQSVSYETAAWRLALLRDFEPEMLPLRRIEQQTLIIAGARDRLLPSDLEAELLASYLPNAQVSILPQSGHACLLETDIRLYSLLQENNLLPRCISTASAALTHQQGLSA